MRHPARAYLPPALALASIAALAVLVPTATAAPEPAATTALPTTTLTTSVTTPGTSVSGTVSTTVPTTPQTTGTWDPCYGTPPSPPSGTTYLVPDTSSTTPPSAPPPTVVNHARAGTATASSTYDHYRPAVVNDGDNSTAFGCQHSWLSANRSMLVNPEWIQVVWPDLQKVGHITVYTTKSAELRDFDIQVLNENGQWWDTVATYNYNTSATVNTWFAPRNTRGVRVLAKVGTSTLPNIARVNEIQAFAY
ncbi:hypothetical protein [Actinokineospora enzanensis]|uniref:galactose-binding domain-containing protein n=1 Tax=Actinokineospora enzanensis TaxID=155975 RepID=UPI00039BD069|nr:hypothetical protein [Actinokineospora enzanensis]